MSSAFFFATASRSKLAFFSKARRALSAFLSIASVFSWSFFENVSSISRCSCFDLFLCELEAPLPDWLPEPAGDFDLPRLDGVFRTSFDDELGLWSFELPLSAAAARRCCSATKARSESAFAFFSFAARSFASFASRSFASFASRSFASVASRSLASFSFASRVFSSC